MSDERRTMFVIAFGVSPAGAPAPSYLAPDGSRTEAKSRAAKFHSFETAQQFAAHHQISLMDDASIGEADFDEAELKTGIVTPDTFR